MSAVVTCTHCKNAGHKIKYCELLTKTSDMAKSVKLDNVRKNGVSIMAVVVTRMKLVISKIWRQCKTISIMEKKSGVITTTAKATRVPNVIIRKDIANVMTVLRLVVTVKNTKLSLQTVPRLAMMESYAAVAVSRK